MNRHRRITLFAFLLILVTPVLLVLAGPDEGTITSSINGARQANGLNALQSHSTLVAYARQHSEEMLGTNSIYHSQSSELTGLVSGWQRIGENVGRGPTAPSIFTAFMNSPGHRDNILGDYTHMGIGTAVDGNGLLYVTTIFMKLPPSTTTTSTSTPPSTTTSTSTSTSTSSPTSTSTSTSTTSTVPESSSTTTSPPASTSPTAPSTSSSTTEGIAVELTVGEAVGCALVSLGTGSGIGSGSAEVVVASCAEAAKAAAAWPQGASVTATEGTDGSIVLTFQFVPETTSTSTSPPDTEPVSSTTTTPAPADFSQPAAPGAAALVRAIAGAVLGIVAVFSLIVLFRRRR